MATLYISLLPPEEASKVEVAFLIGGTLSLLGTLFIVLSYLGLAELRRRDLMQMVFYMAVSDVLFCLKFYIPAVLDEMASTSYAPSHGLCLAEAIIGQFFGVATICWYGCITWNAWLAVWDSFTPRTASMMPLFHTFVWTLSGATTLACWATGQFGESDDGTCWVKGVDNPYRLLFFIPLVLFIFLAATLLVFVVCKREVITMAGQSSVLPKMLAFVLLFFMVWIWPLILRFWEWVSDGAVPLPIMLVHSFMMSAQGFGNCCILLTSDVFDPYKERLRRSLCGCCLSYKERVKNVSLTEQLVVDELGRLATSRSGDSIASTRVGGSRSSSSIAASLKRSGSGLSEHGGGPEVTMGAPRPGRCSFARGSPGEGVVAMEMPIQVLHGAAAAAGYGHRHFRVQPQHLPHPQLQMPQALPDVRVHRLHVAVPQDDGHGHGPTLDSPLALPLDPASNASFFSAALPGSAASALSPGTGSTGASVLGHAAGTGTGGAGVATSRPLYQLGSAYGNCLMVVDEREQQMRLAVSSTSPGPQGGPGFYGYYAPPSARARLESADAAASVASALVGSADGNDDSVTQALLTMGGVARPLPLPLPMQLAPQTASQQQRQLALERQYAGFDPSFSSAAAAAEELGLAVTLPPGFTPSTPPSFLQHPF